MMAMAPVRPVTVTGVAENWPGPEIPFPSSPKELSPQHFTVPPTTTAQAQVWNSAELMASAPVRPATARGGDEKLLIDPVPSSPALLMPQHLTVPVTSNAQ